MLKAVVGIQVEIQRIEGKAKLSQNREVRDRLNAADTLLAKGAEGLGEAMRNAIKES
jgi:transcriptional regulator